MVYLSVNIIFLPPLVRNYRVNFSAVVGPNQNWITQGQKWVTGQMRSFFSLYRRLFWSDLDDIWYEYSSYEGLEGV